MFPMQIDGEVELPDLGQAQVPLVIDRLLDALGEVRAKETRASGNVIEFRGDVVFQNAYVIGGVGDSRIAVLSGSSASVQYALSTREMFATYCALAAGGAALLVVMGLWFLAPVAPVFFFGGYALRYAVTAAQVRSLVQRAVLGASRLERCSNCGAVYDPDDYRADAVERICEVCDERLPTGRSSG